MSDFNLSRRDFFWEISQGIASLTGSRALTEGRLAQLTDALGLTGPLTGRSLYQDVVVYAGLGEHRTATDVDVATGDWLERHLRDLGYEIERPVFTVPQSFVGRTTLLAGKHGLLPVESFPFWPVTFTAAAIVRPLVELSADAATSLAGNVALVTFPYSITGLTTSTMTNHVESAASAGAVAVVAMTEGPTGHLTALNPLRGGRALPIPVVLVGTRDRAALEAAVRSEVPVTLSMEGRSESAASTSNVIGRLVSDVNAPWIVVSTPYSGWFRCGGERGPGIAYWRALSRWLSSRTAGAARLNYLFVATSGHELGQYGMNAFLQNGAPPPEKVPLWLHLGAWMASYAWTNSDKDETPARTKTANSRFLIAPNFSGEALTSLLRLPGLMPQTVAVGEVETVLAAGYSKAMTITGRNVPHHTRLDVAENTGPPMLEPVAGALAKFIAAVQAAIS